MDKILSTLRKVPFWVVAALLPFAVFAAAKWFTGGGHQVLVIGAGTIEHATRATEPKGVAFYDLNIDPNRSMTETEKVLSAAISEWPDVLMYGFATEGLSEDDLIGLVATYESVALEAENTATIPVMVGIPSQHSRVANALWRDTVCAKRTARNSSPIDLRVCVDPSDHLNDPAALQKALAAGAKRGVERLSDMRASTQTGR